jgi:acetylornithine deacetylase/succinyl-diaminopimelate desuccinylase-like protein
MIASLLRKHLDKNGFEDIEIIPYHGEAPAKTSPDTAIVKAAIAAATKVYNQNPVVYPLMAGSGPMYILTQKLGTAALSAGICDAGSGLHAPNENIRLNDYFDGIRFVGELINQFGM